MGASMSLAVFAALVAAITVVASMTVIAAVGLLFYSGREEEPQSPPPAGLQSLAPIYDGDGSVTVREDPLPLDVIDARRLVGFFDEEDSSLSRFDPSAPGRTPSYEAAFGTPEWTEEEGATEIFSAHEGEAEGAFADFEEQPTHAHGIPPVRT